MTGTTGGTDPAAVPPEAIAVVDRDHPPGHPWRPSLLHALAAFYATGGWTPARCARTTPIIGAGTRAA